MTILEPLAQLGTVFEILPYLGLLLSATPICNERRHAEPGREDYAAPHVRSKICARVRIA